MFAGCSNVAICGMGEQSQDVIIRMCAFLYSGTFNIGFGATKTTVTTTTSKYITIYPVFVYLTSYSTKCLQHHVKVGITSDSDEQTITTPELPSHCHFVLISSRRCSDLYHNRSLIRTSRLYQSICFGVVFVDTRKVFQIRVCNDHLFVVADISHITWWQRSILWSLTLDCPV